MTAQEAYNQVRLAKIKETDEQLSLIRDSISKAVSNNQLETCFSGTINENIKEILKSEGYKVKTFSGRMGETENTISWDLTPKQTKWNGDQSGYNE